MTGAREQRLFDAAVEHWGLKLEDTPIASVTGLIGFAERGSHSVVVKVSALESDEEQAADVLRHYRGSGSVRLIDEFGGALLLERLGPGRPLAELALAGKDEAATQIICDVIAKLHQRPSPDGPYTDIEAWGKGFTRYRKSGDTLIPKSLLDPAAELFFELAATQSSKRLLHGDLHHLNILFDDERGWLSIDPKGVVGEPAYELGAALRNPIDDPAFLVTPKVFDRRIAAYAERLELDRSRIVGWAFSQVVLSLIWSVESNDRYGFLTSWLAVAEAMKIFAGNEGLS